MQVIVQDNTPWLIAWGRAGRLSLLALLLLLSTSSHAEKPLSAVEFTTGQANPEQKLPMIIALHGLGDTPGNFSRFLKTLPAPARVVALQAPSAYGSGYSWFPIRAKLGAQDPQLADAVSLATDRIARHIQTYRHTRPTVGKPIVLGFSQGGILSFALAARFPERFQASLPIAGMLPTRLAKATKGQVPVYAFHGAADSIVPHKAGLSAVQTLATLGYPAELKSYPGLRHRFSQALLTDLFDTLGRVLPRPR